MLHQLDDLDIIMKGNLTMREHRQLAMELDQTLRQYKIHRDEDKRRALSDAQDVVVKYENDIGKIKVLGGEPGATLTGLYEKALQLVIDIKASDPLDTKLY